MNFTNATQSDSDECVVIDKSIISDLLMAVYILAFVFGLIFNVLTLGPILQQVRSQNVLGIFLLSLSLSDLLFIFTMPLWINYYHHDHHWKLGVTSCSIAGFFYYSNMYISIYLLCCISVDRCLVVTFPLRFKTHRTSRYAWAQCLSVYVVVMALHILVLVYDNLKDAHDNNDRCYETFPMPKPVALFNLLRVGIGFLLPLLVLAVSYWRVLSKVGQSPGMSAQAKRKVRLLSFGVIVGCIRCISELFDWIVVPDSDGWTPQGQPLLPLVGHAAGEGPLCFPTDLYKHIVTVTVDDMTLCESDMAHCLFISIT
uniref:G protein-coupled receptor 184 n=1 Tax=Myripristis murdjan TaxID=586833 RepID=A0A667YHK0_9TELE